MIKFNKLVIRNFLSYGNVPTVVEFSDSGAVLITGEDLDNTSNGRESNGTGKTSIINALVYALYDKPISDISKDNLINNINKKNLEVTVDFEAHGNQYQVRRCRKLNTNSNHPVYLTENGKDITDAVKVNDRIAAIIGIPYDIFVRIVVFSAAHEPFLALPSRSASKANQTDIIEELFRIKTLSQKADALKKAIQQTDKQIDIEQAIVDTSAQEEERLKQQVANAVQRLNAWEAKRDSDINVLTQKLQKINSVDIEGQRKLHELVSELRAMSKTLRVTITGITNQLKTANSELANKRTEIKSLHANECWYCNQSYPDAANKIDTCSTELTELEAKVEELSGALVDVTQEFDDVNSDIDAYSSQITVDNIQELIEISDKRSVYEDRLQELREATNPHDQALEELQNVTVAKTNRDQLDALMDKVKHQKFLLKLLTKKDSFIRKAILDKNIPYLNTRLQHYLQMLSLPHRVEFTHEMSAKITKFGQELDFGNLSAGQRARVSLALAFAFRDVLQNMHAPINICLLDEVLDVGLSPVGVAAAVRMLKQKAADEGLSLYVVSHREEVDSMFSRILNVQMSQGFSTIQIK